MLAVVLALTASLSWGSSDFLGGIESRRRSVWSVNAVSQAAGVFCALVAVLIAGAEPLSPAQSLAPTLGGVAGGIAIILYYKALRIGAMGIVAPVSAWGVVVPVLVGLARGERPSCLQVVGMALILAGIALVSRTESRAPTKDSLKAIVLAVLTGLGFGTMLVGFDIAGSVDPYWAVFDGRFGAALVIGLYIAVRRPRLEVSLRVVPVLAAVGALLVLANTLFTLATKIGYLSVVAVLSSLGPAVTAGYAGAILGERLTPAQWVGAGTVLVGALLAAAG